MSERVSELRRAFDASFSSPPRTERSTLENLLAVKVARDLYALRVRDIAHLSVTQAIVPLPSRRSELLGLAGVRGTVVPVYSLARVMGYPATDEPGRWLVTCGRPFTLAFAFEEFQGHLQISTAEINRHDRADARRNHLDELVADGAQIRGIVDLTSVVRAITEGTLFTGRTSR